MKGSFWLAHRHNELRGQSKLTWCRVCRSNRIYTIDLSPSPSWYLSYNNTTNFLTFSWFRQEMLDWIYWISTRLLAPALRLLGHSHTLVYSSPRKYHVPVWSGCWVLVAGIELVKHAKYGHRGLSKKNNILVFIIILKNEEGWGSAM